MEAFNPDDRDNDDERMMVNRIAKMMKENRRPRRTEDHEDARYDVVNFGPGGVIPAFSFKEAMKIAKSSKAKHVEIYERDNCIMVFRNL